MSVCRFSEDTDTAALDQAFVNMLQNFHRHRPQPLNVVNSLETLQGRAVDIEGLIQAFDQYMAVVLSDTEANWSCGRAITEIARDYLDDMAADIRGELLRTLPDIPRYA